ncbi:MAG: hypothetical protein LAO30_04515 [Acidobacteriia bacterium]|nr:hypothetical protein [Terriglobia bacterium]
MNIHRPTVLILASNPAFSREITAHWPQGPAPHSAVPEFIVLDEAFSHHLQGSHYDLAIADASAVEKDEDKKKTRRLLNKRLNKDLRWSLAATGKPAIVIHSDPSRDFYNIHGAVIDLRREPGLWPAIAGLIGREILQRYQAESRAREAEKICAAAQTEATLGRFMVEMRTNINNALTTVLGNADLLVHEPGLPATVQAQADAIRNMALRLHEVFQRFSSIEKELSVAARESGKKAAHATAGS